MRILKVYCVVSCLSFLARFVSIIHGIYSQQTGSVATEDSILRMVWSVVGALIFGVEFYGIHKKARFAWYLGWAILAATFGGFLVFGGSAALKVPEIDHPWAAFAAVMVVGFSVLAYWGFWWKHQNGYFTSPGPSIPNVRRKELALVFGISALVIAAFTLLSGLGGNYRELANQAVKQFHEQLAAGQYVAIYDGADESLRKATSESDFVNLLESMDQKLGTFEGSNPNFTGITWGKNHEVTVRLTFDANFANGTGTEDFVWRIVNNRATLSRYQIKSKVLTAK